MLHADLEGLIGRHDHIFLPTYIGHHAYATFRTFASNHFASRRTILLDRMLAITVMGCDNRAVIGYITCTDCLSLRPRSIWEPGPNANSTDPILDDLIAGVLNGKIQVFSMRRTRTSSTVTPFGWSYASSALNNISSHAIIDMQHAYRNWPHVFHCLSPLDLAVMV